MHPPSPTTMSSNISPPSPRSARPTMLALILALLASLSACGADDTEDGGAGTLSSVEVDPVVVDEDGKPDGRAPETIPWDEVGPGWTLVVYEPGPIEEARTAGLYLIDAVGRRYDVAEVDLGERYVLGIQDWLPHRRAALLTRTHRTAMDENPQPSALELLDLERGDRRELAPIVHGQVNVASLSRPTGKVILFADGVGGPLERRSTEWERLSTVADEAFAWAHSPDGALVAVSTLPPTEPSRLTVNANDTGDELVELTVPDAYRFCDAEGWWDPGTLLGSCGTTGVVQPRSLWLFPTDGSPPRQLLVGEATSVTDAVLLPDGQWLALGVDGGLWATETGARLADLPDGATMIGASSVGVVIAVDGELRVIDPDDGASATLLPRDPDAVGVTSAVTLTSASFTAERPPADGSLAGPTDDSTDGATPPPAAPDPGQALVVVGIDLQDVLNFRAEPDPSAEIVDTARPDIAQYPKVSAIVATGEARAVGSSVWWEVTVDGQSAWANSRYLGVLGPVDDLSAELAGLEATHEVSLENVVAAARPYGAAGILVYAEGVDAISSYFTIDTLGSVGTGIKGERFTIEAGNIREPDEDGLDRVVGFEVWTAQRTLICQIGVDPSGQCR